MEYLQYWEAMNLRVNKVLVLNLIINGIPSIRYPEELQRVVSRVLNLIINGIPSIPKLRTNRVFKKRRF